MGRINFLVFGRERGAAKDAVSKGHSRSVWLRASLAATGSEFELSCPSAGIAENICWQESNSIVPSWQHEATLCRCALGPSHATSQEPSLLGRCSLQNKTSPGWLKGFVYCYRNGISRVQVKSDTLHWVIGELQPQGRKACACAHSHSSDLPWGTELGWSESVPPRAGPACAHGEEKCWSRR